MNLFAAQLCHVDPNRRYDLRRICGVQIQPRKDVLDHAGYTAFTRQHDVDHTDHKSICYAWQI